MENEKYGMTLEQMQALGGVISGNIGKAKELTSADYNYPTDSPNSIALWLLDDGVYTKPSNVATKITTTTSIASNQTMTFIIGKNDTAKTMLRLSNDSGNANNLTYYWIDNNGAVYFDKNIISDVVNNLTSTSTSIPLSANQGKVLNEKIGDLPALNTTTKISVVAAINEVLASASGIKTLTSADYNWNKENDSTDNPDAIAMWLLPVGVYTSPTETVYITNDQNEYLSLGSTFILTTDGYDPLALVYNALGTLQIYQLASNGDSGGTTSYTAYMGEVGNATLTIQQNGTTVDTFSANATQNKTINIQTPTTFTSAEWNALWGEES